MTTTAEIKYWTNRLQEIDNEITPLLNSMYEQNCNLSIEEQYALRELLSQNKAVVHHLLKVVPEFNKQSKKRFRRK